VTASARSFPDRMCGSTTGTSKMPICTWPPTRSFTAGAAPFVGTCNDIDARLRLQQFAGQMRNAAGASGTVIDLARIRLRVGNQFGQRIHRHA
jgi:hypothetical protein